MAPRLSIGARWSLRYAVATMLLLGLLSWLLYGRLAEQILRDAEVELARQTSNVTDALRRNLDRSLLSTFVAGEVAGVDPELRLAIELFDADHQSWLRHDILSPFEEPLPSDLPSGPGKSRFFEVKRSDPYPYFVMIVHNGRGLTRASVYGKPFLQRVEQVRSLFLFAIAGTLVLTGMLSWWLARQSLKPIARITEIARRTTAAPSGELIPVHGSGDELDQLAETLNEMLVRIRSGVSRMRRFSTDAAHQLRTPLTALHTRLEVTLERERTLGEYQRVLAETLAEIQLLEAGVRSILQLAESATGHTPGQRQLVGLKPVLWSVADFFQPLAREAGIELHCELSQDLDVWGDPASLHHLFANLVDNAIKYSKPGASVTLGLEREPGFARVEVRDTGPGIQKEDRARIFEDFFRGGEPSSVGGIGLGLTLALEIARAHGGTIELEGNSSGSTFHVRLPTGSLPAG